MPFKLSLATLLVLTSQFCLAQKGTEETQPPDKYSQVKTLDQNWEFYWDQLITPQEFLNHPPKSGEGPIDKLWTKDYNHFGIATYRTKILLDNHPNLMLSIHGVKGGYKVWLNDLLIGGKGVVGRDSKHLGTNERMFIPIPDSLREFFLTVWVSNYTNFSPGINSKPTIGTLETIAREYRNDTLMQFLYLIPILILSIYCLYNFFIYERNLSYLLLSLICWCIMVRSISYSDVLSFINYTLLKRVEFASVYLIISLFPLYIYEIFPSRAIPWFRKVCLVIGIVFALVALLAPVAVYHRLLNFAHAIFFIEFLYAGFLLWRNFRRKRRDFILTMIGLAIAVFLFLIEILKNSGFLHIHFLYFVEIGVLVFLFFQTLVLQLKHTTELEELKELQRGLEETVKQRTLELVEQKTEAVKQFNRSEELLLNILPFEIAGELKLKGYAEAKYFDQASVLFTDFKSFTEVSESMSAHELVSEIDYCFKKFDGIVSKYGIEKIKTIGDSYMAVGGLPAPTPDSTKNTVLAAIEMQSAIVTRKLERDAMRLPSFEMRLGIHTGPVVAGIVGHKKFQYDIWGDTVNTASRLESSGHVGRVNISQTTYEILKEDPTFSFEKRGRIAVKGKGEVEMHFVSRTK